MEHAPATGVVAARTTRLAFNMPFAALAGWAVGFASVLYLALSNGGYDTVVRNQSTAKVGHLLGHDHSDTAGDVMSPVPSLTSHRVWSRAPAT